MYGHKIGAEFKEALGGGCFFSVPKGQGTHVWNGHSIVPKPEEEKKTKPKNRKRGETTK